MSERDLSPLAPPDLQILVRLEDSKKLFFEARSDRLSYPNMDLGFLNYEVDAKIWAQDELGRNVENLSDLIEKDERNRDLARRQLADLAVALFQKLPKDLQKLLWSCQGQIETVQILSDEPYFPWELLKLQGEAGEEGPFLCEIFSVTRWLRNRQTVGELPLQRIALVLPTDSDRLSPKGEKEDLIALVGSERVAEVTPTLSEVKDALAGGDFDAWHFAGHGWARRIQDPNRAQLWLDGEDVLTPTNLVTAKANLSRLHPLVFLNGCDTGRSGFSLTGLGGWAYQSLAAGAGAFIGTLWPVRDSKARTFAQAFYKAFLGGEPFGEAVRQARLRVRDDFPGDPDWLAYTVYAHPGTVCSTATGKPTQRESPLSPLRIPDFEWRQEISPPGALLRAEYGIVPFHGRGKEESELHSWCTEGSSLRVRLYTGPGGMGKTRLALEIAKALRKEGWRAGFLEQGRSPEEAWKAISRPGGKVLAIIDYAETRRELLIPLLRRLYATDAGPIRLILLARAALDWWEQLKAEGQGVGELLSGPATSRHALRSLAFTPQERSESYHLAGQAFAQKLNTAAAGEVPEDLGDSIYERVLLLHMRALASIEGIEVKGEDGVLDYVLNREQRYWTQRALDRKLTASVVTGVSRAMAAITLGGGVEGEAEAVDILSRLRAFKGHTGDVLLGVAHLLHECYPGEDRWIEPILPDLLGEHLVQREMEQGADELLNLVLGPAQQ